MQGLPLALVKKLDLRSAITEEASSIRNLVPAEPGWDRIAESSTNLAQWIGDSLRSGLVPGSQRISRVRKTPGVRPVAHWGPVERIVYRALTRMVLGRAFDIDRSPEKYVEFIKAPVEYSYDRQKERLGESASSLQFFLGQSDLKYVVKSDISAFYQYVDHSILGAELRVHGGGYEAVNGLLELLAETQGRTYGLPQLLDASDALSELYIDIVERALLRQGFPTWRFNDDFRIGCQDYNEALRSIEALDVAARNVGLVLNENKTLTYGFLTYMEDSLNVEITDEHGSVLLNEVEARVGDYTDDFSDDIDSARNLVEGAGLGPRPGGGTDLQRATSESARLLRRALNALAIAQDTSVVSYTQRLFTYVPELTPAVLGYLREVHSSNSDEVEGVIDGILGRTSMNDWQRLWMVDTLRGLEMLDGNSVAASSRTEWAEKVRTDSDSSMARAIASLALARAGKRTFRDVVRDYERSYAPALVWALEAVREAYRVSPTADNQKSVEAVAATSPLHRALLA